MEGKKKQMENFFSGCKNFETVAMPRNWTFVDEKKRMPEAPPGKLQNTFMCRFSQQQPYIINYIINWMGVEWGREESRRHNHKFLDK